MANSNGIIYAPATEQDIAEVIGTQSHDGETIMQLSTINKWAKFKPFRYADAGIVPVVDASGYPTRQTSPTSHYQCLIEANCGLYINYRNYGRDACISKTRSMIQAGNDDDIWQYNRPNGSVSQPYRWQDFIGYYKDAMPFLWQSNIAEKKIPYRGSEDWDKEVGFGIEVYDSNNESIEGMIEPSDLQDTIYNGNNLYYYVAVCYPVDYSVLAASMASQPIANVDGRSVSFQIRRNSSGDYQIRGNVSQSVYNGTTILKMVHMLARVVDGNIESFIPIPYDSVQLPITTMEIQGTSTSVQFNIDSIGNFASNGQAVAALTFYSINNDIAIHNWSGLTVKLSLTNSSGSAITINMGYVYCQTNCHTSAVACTAIYNSNYQQITNRQVTVPANGSVSMYMTFADVFDFDNNGGVKMNNTDVEISLWGEDSQGEPTINVQTYGNDGTIIYYTT